MRCSAENWRRKPAGARVISRIRTSAGRPSLRNSGRNSGSPTRPGARVSVRQGIGGHVNVGDLPLACTPASVRPAVRSRTAEDGSQRRIEIARALPHSCKPSPRNRFRRRRIERRTTPLILGGLCGGSSGPSRQLTGADHVTSPRQVWPGLGGMPPWPSPARQLPGVLIGLREVKRLPDQFDHGHRSVVALTCLALDDTVKPPSRVGEERSDLMNKVCTTSWSRSLSTSCRLCNAFFGMRDQLLRVWTQRPGPSARSS